MNLDGKASRGRRRMARDRMIAKALRVADERGIRRPNYIRLADHLQFCSGLCCGNRRRYEGRDLDELRHIDSMRHDIEDLA